MCKIINTVKGRERGAVQGKRDLGGKYKRRKNVKSERHRPRRKSAHVLVAGLVRTACGVVEPGVIASKAAVRFVDKGSAGGKLSVK